MTEHHEQAAQHPWHIDPENAAETFPEYRSANVSHKVAHRYKDIYHSTPYHKRWSTLPSEVLLRVWVPNGRLAIERLSLFIQSWLGPADMEEHAASMVLDTLTWPNRPTNEQLPAVAHALDHILASNGGHAGTLTLALTATEFDFERSPGRYPVYLRFQKDVADTDVDITRYPDCLRTDERNAGLDYGLVRTARRIQTRAADPPVEIVLAMQSYRTPGCGDISIGVDIRRETSLDDLYRSSLNKESEQVQEAIRDD